jgi:vacuolar-type H+-ATPase subunit H
VLRLSELLERIRPAGAPGAAAEGDDQHRRNILAAEIADIERALAAFEHEADQLVATAREEAEQLRRDGDRRADQIRAGLADRVAVAQAAGTERQQTDAEHDAIVESARRDAQRVRTEATSRIPALADSIVDSIWSDLPTEGRP